MIRLTIAVLAFLTSFLPSALSQYPDWRHSGTITVLTTADGANLPAGAAVEGFPLLVNLDKDWFDFQQARPQGEDIRFSTATGTPMAYEVEKWDAAAGT